MRPAGAWSIDLTPDGTVWSVNAGDSGLSRPNPCLDPQARKHHLRDQGLFFPIVRGATPSLRDDGDPRASGTQRGAPTGTMKDNVLRPV